MKTHRKVLLIEDSASDTALISEMLREAVATQFETTNVTSLAEAVRYLSHPGNCPDVVLVDLNLPDSTGFQTLVNVRAVRPTLPFVVLTHVDDSEIAVEAVRHGAQDWLTKEYVLSNLLERSLTYAIERNNMQLRLRSSEERFRQLAENINEVFWLSDVATGGLVYISPAYERIWGRRCESLYENRDEWLEAIVAREGDDIIERVRQNWLTGQHDLEYQIERPDGSVRWIHDRGTPIHNSDGDVYRVAGTAADITARKQLEREISELTVNEQRRIGHELHDSFGQQLTGIGLLARSLEKKLEATDCAEAAAELAENLTVAQRQLRKLVKGLMPVEVDASGLMAALAQLATATERLCNVVCTFACDRPVAVENAGTATHLYQIAAEAVNNAVRHAGARHIRIGLTDSEGILKIQVRDDGVGLAEDYETGEGMGLRIMRHRAGVIGAAIDVRSADDGGTAVTCTLRQGN
jgi:PAS domain S-box-containing protein